MGRLKSDLPKAALTLLEHINRSKFQGSICLSKCVCVCVLRPCIPLNQLVELDFRKLLNLTLTKVVISYITRELYKTSCVKNNKFLATITSFLTKIASFLTKTTSILTKMTFQTLYITEITINLLYNDQTCYITSLIVVFVFHEL